MSEIIPDVGATEASDERAGLPSASSMDADVRCYGRRAFIAKVIKADDSTKWTKRGDRIHKALEKNDLEGLAPSDQVTAERIMFEEARLVDHYSMQGARIFSERRWWGMGEDMKPIYSAKLDRIHHLGNVALIIDYKTGFAPVVPIPKNYQMKTQAVLTKMHLQVDAVVAVLIHPHHPDLLSQIIPYRGKDLDFIETEIEGHVSQMVDGAMRTPNSISCAFCQARGLCPEYQEWMSKIIPAQRVEAVRAKLEFMSPDERGSRLQQHAMAKDMIEEEKKICKDLLKKDPLAITGYRLVGSAERIITDHRRAYEIIARTINEDAADACMEISIPKVEGALAVAGIAKSKVKEEANKMLFEVIDKKPREKSLKEI